MPAGAITLSDISSADWSLELDSTAGLGPASGIGNVVQGVNDVNQCIAVILSTPKGTDPLRPDFACDLWQFIDYPVDAAIPAIVAEITDAITRWEPRVKLLSVLCQLINNGTNANSGANLQIAITWQLNLKSGTPSPQTLTLTIPSTLG